MIQRLPDPSRLLEDVAAIRRRYMHAAHANGIGCDTCDLLEDACLALRLAAAMDRVLSRSASCLNCPFYSKCDRQCDDIYAHRYEWLEVFERETRQGENHEIAPRDP